MLAVSGIGRWRHVVVTARATRANYALLQAIEAARVEVLPSGEVGWSFFEVFDRQRREPGLFRRWERWQGCESLEGLASVSPGIPVDEAMKA